MAYDIYKYLLNKPPKEKRAFEKAFATTFLSTLGAQYEKSEKEKLELAKEKRELAKDLAKEERGFEYDILKQQLKPEYFRIKETLPEARPEGVSDTLWNTMKNVNILFKEAPQKVTGKGIYKIKLVDKAGIKPTIEAGTHYGSGDRISFYDSRKDAKSGIDQEILNWNRVYSANQRSYAMALKDYENQPTDDLLRAEVLKSKAELDTAKEKLEDAVSRKHGVEIPSWQIEEILTEEEIQPGAWAKFFSFGKAKPTKITKTEYKVVPETKSKKLIYNPITDKFE